MAEEVAESYKSSLDELVINSKPQISMLTMLAEDHLQYASEIIRVIEEQIKKAYSSSRSTAFDQEQSSFLRSLMMYEVDLNVDLNSIR